MTALVIFLVCTNFAVAGFAVKRGMTDARTILRLVEEGAARQRRLSAVIMERGRLYRRLYQVTKRHTHVGTFDEFYNETRKEMTRD